MNDDYLWDRTGKPDPEIQQLEEVLGTLRYQPRPLAIPAQVQSGKKQSHFSHFAIAAAIAVMVFGAGWWLLLTSRRAVDSARVRQTPAATAADPASVASKAVGGSEHALRSAIRSTEDDKIAQPRRSRAAQMLAGNVSRGRRQVVKRYEAITSERIEAEAAKEQLLLALRVASAKLSLAQKRTQGTYPANMIRNQHKVG
ncbi:MAG: hypothetical protein ACR2G5_17250 [Pyrinomonadaceae bacterium]